MPCSSWSNALACRGPHEIKTCLHFAATMCEVVAQLQEVDSLKCALRRAHDEAATVVDDIIDMAAQAGRDAERIAQLEAALSDAQVPHLPCTALIVKAATP